MKTIDRPTLDERKKEIAEMAAFLAENHTGFTKFGNGNAVHATRHMGGRTLLIASCGVQGTGSAQVRTGTPAISFVDGPVTCKRCLQIDAK